MTHPSKRPITPSPSDKPDAEWAVRLAAGGVAGFTLLLIALGLMLYNAWPQMSGVRQTVGSLNAKADHIVAGQELLSRDITTLRADLRDDKARRAGESKELAAVQSRIAELSSAVAKLQDQAAKLEEAPKPAGPTPHAAAAASDPEVAELRARLDQLQRRLDQLAAAPVAPIPAAPVAVAPAKPNYPVDEIEREVRDMQEVVRQQRLNPQPHSPVASRRTAPSPNRPSFGDPLAPLTSKSPPRIAPVSSPAAAQVSLVPLDGSAQQTISPERAVGGEPEPRVTKVGLNSAMKALGPIGLPFDAFGNLFTAIGEGLDHLFTGRTYLPRPTPGDEPATARR